MAAQKTEPLKVLQIPAMLTPAEIYCSNENHDFIVCDKYYFDNAIQRTVCVNLDPFYYYYQPPPTDMMVRHYFAISYWD